MSVFVPVFQRYNFEDKKLKSSLDKILIGHRGHTFKLPEKGSPVLLIVSGGIDSIMLWFTLLRKFKLVVYPIHFIGQQSIAGENMSVAFFYRFFKKKYPELVKSIHYVPIRYNFSFTDRKNRQLISDNAQLLVKNLFQSKETGNKKVMLIDYPVRFAYYSLAAYEYSLKLLAKGIKVNTVLTGIVPDDGFTIRESTLTVLRALNVYLCAILGNWDWQISGFLERKAGLFYTKKQEIHDAIKYGVPLEKTWSCNYSLLRHCGVCNACKNRKQGFKDANSVDPTRYLISKSHIQIVKKIQKTIYAFLHIFSFMRWKNSKTSPLDMNVKQKIKLNPQSRYYIENGTSYIYDHKNGTLLKLNKMGGEIISAIIKKKNIILKDLLFQIVKPYESSEKKRVKKDVLSFIKTMMKKNIIVSI